MNTVATEVSKPVTTQPERKVEPITKVTEAEFLRHAWLVIIPFGTLPEDLLKPEYWAHVAAQLRPRERIEAHSIDGTWFAEYLVLGVDRTWAKVHMLSKHSLTTPDIALSQAEAVSPYEVKWRGPVAKWSIVRKSDNAVQAEGMDKDQALDWLKGH